MPRAVFQSSPAPHWVHGPVFLQKVSKGCSYHSAHTLVLADSTPDPCLGTSSQGTYTVPLPDPMLPPLRNDISDHEPSIQINAPALPTLTGQPNRHS